MLASICALCLQPSLPAGSIQLVAIEEHYPVNIKQVNASTGSISTLNTQHVLEFKYRMMRPDAPTGGTGTPPDNEIGVAMMGACAYKADFSGTSDFGVSTLLDEGTYGLKFTMDDDYSNSEYTVSLYVVVGGTSHPSTLKVCLISKVWTWNSMTSSYQANTSYTMPYYSLERVLCSKDAAIDTRRGYGVANAEGGLDPDPNWTYLHPNFGDYTYRGGLFTGNMTYSTSRDWSGTSRIQVKPGSVSASTVVFATATLFDTGYRAANTGQQYAAFNIGAPSIGVYIPSETDTNLGVAESEMTWDNRWDVTPTDDPPPFGDKGKAYAPSTVADTTFSMDPEEPNYYVNWRITSINPDGATNYTPPFSHGLVFAVVNEADAISGGINKWRYFASKEYEGLSVPLTLHTDSRPRIWVLGDNGTHTWGQP